MPDTKWWQKAVIYQVYPRSFQDSNGDGVGDLRGITQRLPYLADLGVCAIWLSPIFTSPMEDFGYDITDYRGIDPLFGTMAEFDELVARAHQLDLRVLLDLVPNHTSSLHPWFVESRASRSNPKRDWYIWRDPAPGGGVPNNWLSEFGGSAWAFDEASGQYYYHAFLPSQPDLNWRNPAVRRAMHDVMRFWLAKGVDGFRIDVLWHLIKDDQFRDNPPNPEYRDGQPAHWRVLPLYTTDRPEVHQVVAGFRSVADEFADRLLLGEIYLPPKRLVAYYGKDLEGVHLPFNFGLLETDWHARKLARLIEEYETALPSAVGRTGCSAIMTGRGSPAVSVLPRRGSPRCCCSRYVARRPSITVTRSAFATLRSHRNTFATRSAKPPRLRAATVRAARCAGTKASMAGFRLRRHGAIAPNPQTMQRSRRKRASQLRFSTCTSA